MDFEESVNDEKRECSTGSGNVNDFNAEDCRCSCANEFPCIFPYLWNGKLVDKCAFLEEEEFLFPVFRCPIRNITRKFEGINNFTYADLVKQVYIGEE